MRGQLAITPVSGEGKEITGGLFFWGFVMLFRTEAPRHRETQGSRCLQFALHFWGLA